MNKKISGAKLVLVPITMQGKNYFPFIEDLKDRVIKYIDFYPTTYLPMTTATGTTSSSNIFVSLADKVGNKLLMNGMPLDRFNYASTLGIRQEIGDKISLQNSYLECQNSAMVGTTAAMVFYYDLPEFSARNTTTNLVADSLTVPLTTGTFYNSLPDSDRMAGKRFRRLLVSDPTTTPDYQTGVTTTELANIYITLRKGSYMVVDNLPVMLLYQLQMLQETEWANIVFDLQASFLTIGGAGTIPSLQTDYIGKSVFLNLAYEK